MRRLVILATVALSLAACGGSSRSGRGHPSPPTGASDAVVRVVTSDGFTAESRRPARLPQLSVFGDGRVVTVGPTTLETPGAALPNLQELRVTGDALRRILQEARVAGVLDDPAPDYGDPGVTDQATTTVTVRADGATHRVSVYALGFTGRVSGVTPEQSQNRRRLQRFIERAGDPGALGGDVVPGSTRRYEPTAIAALVHPSDTTAGATHAWPLGDLTGTECTVYEGAELATVLDVARTAREGDAWESAGATYSVAFRPLLPDERTCADLREPYRAGSMFWFRWNRLPGS
jgi:hypothetical protein